MKTQNVAGRQAGAKLLLSCATLLLLLAGQALAQPATYTYTYGGETITLEASKELVAIDESAPTTVSFALDPGLERHPLSSQAVLRARNFSLYRVADAAVLDLGTEMVELASASPEGVQPVFEQGGALLIPSNEVLVGLTEAATLEAARDLLAPHMDSQGIVAVNDSRGNTFLLRIDNAAMGRAFAVSQFLAGQAGVEFSEPNHIVVQLDTPLRPTLPPPSVGEPLSDDEGEGLEMGADTAAAVGWTNLVTTGCDGASLPTGWSTGLLNSTYADVTWNTTDEQTHAGTHSCYASGGGSAGVAAPGPYPANAFSVLDSPTLDLLPFEEVYVEFWFYAKFTSGSCTVKDCGQVGIFDTGTGVTDWFKETMAVCYTGDLTADPTTDGGWRRMLVRVPPALRKNDVRVRLAFLSDDDVGAEGLYVDEIRIAATIDVDTEPIGNDTYGARLYEMKNSGQLAGLGGDANDMQLPEAWAEVSVSSDVVVAVIDSGVEDHPDLNLDPGFDPDGSSGGGPRGNHGTAVAGNVGAIGDNSAGVMGTAPGVRIMPVYGGGTLAERADSIDVAVAEGADILSNSWGWVGAPSAAITSAINDALAAGRVVVFAAGNGPDRSPWTYESAYPGLLTGSADVICVGASSPLDEHKATASADGSHFWGSSYVGDCPDVVAPGPWSYTTDRLGAEGYNDGSAIDPDDPASADYTNAFGGTSSATPKVAGVVALMLSANPELTPAKVKQILRHTAEDIDAPGVDDKTGAGRVNALAAVQGARAAATGRDPVDIVLALDYSDSMNSPAEAGGSDKIDVLKDAVEIFLTTWGIFAVPDDQAEVVFFDDTDVDPLAISLETLDVDALIAEVRGRPASGYTPMGGAVQVALTGLSSEASHPAILLFTNGIQNVNPMALEVDGHYEIINGPGAWGGTSSVPPAPGVAVGSYGIPIHIIAIGAAVDGPYHTLLDGLRLETDGLIHPTTSPDTDLRRFYLEQLVAALYHGTPEMVGYRYATSSPDPAVGEVFEVDGSITRAAFVVHWREVAGTVPPAIQIYGPGGVPLQPTRWVPEDDDDVEYYRTAVFDFPYFKNGQRFDPVGDWRVAVAPAPGSAAMPYQVTLLVDELEIHYDFDLPDRILWTGDPIALTAEVTVSGQPVPLESAKAKIGFPRTALGTFLATDGTLKRRPARPPATPQPPPPPTDLLSTPARAKLLELLEDPRLSQLLRPKEKTLDLTPSGGGSYGLTFDDTTLPGVYRFEVSVTGSTPAGEPIARTQTLSTMVRVKPDRQATKTVAEWSEQRTDGSGKARVTVIPFDAHGNFLGPDYAGAFEASATGASFDDDIGDALDGSYELLLEVPDRSKDPELAIAVLGFEVYRGPLSKILRPAERFGFSIHAGLAYPHGDLDRFFDEDHGFALDFEVVLSHRLSFEGIFGHYTFDGQDGDQSIDHLSANLKYFSSVRRVRGFVNGGAGAYKAEGDSSIFLGLNAGGGVSWQFRPRVYLETSYNYHLVFADGGDLELSTVMAGLKWRF